MERAGRGGRSGAVQSVECVTAEGGRTSHQQGGECVRGRELYTSDRASRAVGSALIIQGHSATE